MPSHLAVFRALPSYSILPMQFVTFDGVAGDFLIRPATAATDIPVGVSQVGYDVPPNLIQALSSNTATYTPVAAQPGEELACYTIGDIAPVVLGAAVTAGSMITFNSSGLAVMAVPGAGSWFGGIAVQAGSTGGVIDIFVALGKS